MGGYGSGRTKRHELTNECISIDTMALKKHLHKPGKVGGSFTVSGLSERHFKDGKANLCCIVECYTTPQQSHGARYPVYGQVSLHYAVQSDTQPENHAIDIPLVTTTCNYGGQRWWMIAPCCGRRCRAVYISHSATIPLCRICHDLHYESQCSSYIDKHITREKYLLANYGYAWAEMEYLGLREHYLKITPEIEQARQQSILQMRMRMLRCLMSFNRIMLRSHMYALRSLKSEEDRRVYVDFLIEQHGESYAMDLVHMLGISIQIERDAHESSSAVFDQGYKKMTDAIAQSLQDDEEDPDTWQAIVEATEASGKLNMRYLLAYKQQVEDDIKHLKEAA